MQQGMMTANGNVTGDVPSNGSGERAPYFADVYAKLAAPFAETFTDVRGGVTLTYVSGEQVISRLNEVLGVAGWSFRVIEHGIHLEADEVWVIGELTANFGGTTVVRQQAGSQKLKRSRSTDKPLDIGFDMKGGATDALKKCASLIGVGLYLSKKNAPAVQAARQAQAQVGSAAATTSSAPASSETYVCEQCDEDLKEIRFKDGTLWTPAILAAYGRRKHGHVYCIQHYREANEAKKKAEAQAPGFDDSVPF